MKLRTIFAAALALSCNFEVASAQEQAPPEGRLRIVASTPNLAALCREVGGKWVTVKSVWDGTGVAKRFRPPQEVIDEVEQADLYVAAGGRLAGTWEDGLTENARKKLARPGVARFLDCGTIADLLAGGAEKGQKDALLSPSEPPADYLLDPYAGLLVAHQVAAKLKLLQPKSWADFDENLRKFQSSLTEAMFGPQLSHELSSHELWRLESSGQLNDFLKEKELEHAIGGWAAIRWKYPNRLIASAGLGWTYFGRRFDLKIRNLRGVHVAVDAEAFEQMLRYAGLEYAGGVVIVSGPEQRDRLARFCKTGRVQFAVCPPSVGPLAGAGDYVSLVGEIASALERSFRAMARDMVRQYRTIPPALGVTFTEGDAEPLIEILNDPDQKKLWACAIAGLAFIGSDAAFEAVRNFVEAPRNGEVGISEFRALRAAPPYIGKMAWRNEKAYEFILAGIDEDFWEERVDWTHKMFTHDYIVKAQTGCTIHGLGACGREDAWQRLDALLKRPESYYLDHYDNIIQACYYRWQIRKYGLSAFRLRVAGRDAWHEYRKTEEYLRLIELRRQIKAKAAEE